MNFFPPTEHALRKRIRRELLAAKNELMSAESAVESAIAYRSILIERAARLQAQLDADVAEQKAEKDRWTKESMPPPHETPKPTGPANRSERHGTQLAFGPGQPMDS